jgi:cytochrome P450
MIRQVVSRISSRILLGTPYCRNEKWLTIAQDHTISIFATTLTLRMFPPAFHPVLSLLIPRRWKIWSNINESNKILRPIIEEYRAELANGNKPRTLLHWMVQNATEVHGTVEALTLSQLSVAVASVYTSSQVTSHLLFDLAANPEYIELVREEIRENVPDLSRIDPNKLPMLDACLTETLRRNPPLLSKSCPPPTP